MEMVSRIFWGKLFWIVAPTFDAGRVELHYIHEALAAHGLIAKANMPQSPGEWNLRLTTGQVIRVLSAQDVLKIAGSAPDGILMVEAAQQPEEAYLRCCGRIVHKDGWLCINGTLEGSTNWFASRWREWYAGSDAGARAYCIPTWSNTNTYPTGRKDPRIVALEARWPREYFLERFAGIPVKPSGIVFREFEHTRHVRRVQIGGPPPPPEDRETVYLPEDIRLQLWCDPGYNASCAVLAVARDGERAIVVDELYLRYRKVQEVIRLCQNRWWWDRVDFGVFDIAGSQHTNGQQSAFEAWQAPPPDGPGLALYGRKLDLIDSINRVRTFLRPAEDEPPRLLFDPRCAKTIWELAEAYRYNKDGTSDTPVDRDNHAISALRYGIVHNWGTLDRRVTTSARPRWTPPWHRSH